MSRTEHIPTAPTHTSRWVTALLLLLAGAIYLLLDLTNSLGAPAAPPRMVVATQHADVHDATPAASAVPGERSSNVPTEGDNHPPSF